MKSKIVEVVMVHLKLNLKKLYISAGSRIQLYGILKTYIDVIF